MFSRLKRIKIATRIALVFGLALPLTLWTTMSEVGRSWDVYQNTKIASSQNAAANMLILGVYEILLERQYINNSLQKEKPANADELRDIQKHRVPATEKIDAVVGGLFAYDFPNKSAVTAEFNAARDKANLYRSKSDAALKLPFRDRDPDTVKNTYAVLSAFVETSERLWNRVLSNAGSLDPELARLASIRVLAWNMRDVAGRERATISAALTANAAIAPDKLTAIVSIRSQVDVMWRLLQSYINDQDHAAVIGGIQSIKAGYFAKFRPLADTMQKSSAERLVGKGGDYPMTISQWVDTTTPLLSTILDVMNGAGKAAEWRALSQMNEALHHLIVSVVLQVATVVLFVGAIVFSGWTVARPLRALTGPLDELANGNFAVAVPGLARQDEIGQIAGAVNSMAGKIRTTIAEIKSSAREVTNASAEISTSTTDLSQRTEEQAASLEETSASMEEISTAVKKNAENAQQANRSAATARAVADRGGQVVAKVVGSMAKIEDSSHKIADIIGVIDEIARQTNLLALNAAVEAARAGEAGRGFAVVASEVRSLAQRSSQAAKDIKALITNSNSQVKDGVDLANQAGAALNEITESIKAVAAIVDDIAKASIEQSTGIEQVNKALTQMDEVTQQNSALVEENAATAKTLEHQAKSMGEQVAFFQIDAAAGAEGMTTAKTVTAKPATARASAAQSPCRLDKPQARRFC